MPLRRPFHVPFQLSRRKFLLIGATALAAVGVERVAVWRRSRGLWSPRARAQQQVGPVVAVLRQKLDYLRLSDGALDTFARDFQARGDAQLKRLSTENPTEFADELTVQFLLSTDFFLNGADESRPVSYRSYYDPYDGCSNPFAEFD
jgi:hypothetical protein